MNFHHSILSGSKNDIIEDTIHDETQINRYGIINYTEIYPLIFDINSHNQRIL